MNTSVVIQSTGAGLTASPASVAILPGSTVAFQADGVGAMLCFADETIGIMSPSPSSPTKLAAGSSLSFEFTSAAPGSYPVLVLASGSAAPAIIDFEAGGAEAKLTITATGGRPTPTQQDDNGGN